MPAAVSGQLEGRSPWPSDVQQWPEGPDLAAAGGAGPSEQRAAKRSADDRRETEAPKQQRAATSHLEEVPV